MKRARFHILRYEFFFREKARQQASESKSQVMSKRMIDDIERYLPSEIQDFGTHTVAVTHIDSLAGVRNGEEEDDDEVRGFKRFKVNFKSQ